MTRRTGIARSGYIGFLGLALSCSVTLATERSYPIDCWGDRLAEWKPVAANPQALFGAAFLPGIFLGPPGDSSPSQGSFSVASFGYGGRAVIAFDDIVIEDRPGPDFIVFENAFFQLPLPTSDGAPFFVFAEPGIVEVSADGSEWHAFPYDAGALAEVPNQPNGTIDADLYHRLRGLAGITPTFTGNWTVPDDPEVFDPSGPGGVSGAGGDAFDLADVGLEEARFVRITDGNTHAGPSGQGEGFDLDSIVVLNGRPVAPIAPDADGDGLSDAEEEVLYGSDPDLADSDGDGTDDGREVAGCRDPGSFGTAPWHHMEPRLWLVRSGPCHEVRWSFLGTNVTYDLVRGELGLVAESPGSVDLGPVECLASGTTSLRFSCDDDTPPAGEVRFFLVRVASASSYGRSSALDERTASPDCP